MSFWIVRYSHRHGDNCWPIFRPKGVGSKWSPSLEWLLSTDKEFAGEWEGEGSSKVSTSPIDDCEDERGDEFCEFYGPFEVPDDGKGKRKKA